MIDVISTPRYRINVLEGRVDLITTLGILINVHGRLTIFKNFSILDVLLGPRRLIDFKNYFTEDDLFSIIIIKKKHIDCIWFKLKRNLTNGYDLI